MSRKVQLVTYADRLGGDLRGLQSLLDNELNGLFGGVHILPFFDPIDGADAGFDPVDHTRVDPRIGHWQDITSLSANFSVMADLIVNHVSSDSAQFQDVRRLGPTSAFWNLFIRKDEVFDPAYPDTLIQEEINRIYRPRPGSPFTSIKIDDGSIHEFWTTFSSKQLDINVESTEGRKYLDRVLKTFAEGGIREVRLDAAGYAIKRHGTTCFMLPETFEFIGTLSGRAAELGMEALVEVHSHYATQINLAVHLGRVYDFALPPLILHAFFTGDAEPCKRWLQIAPRDCVTVLDTHDGIGILDVARQGDIEGLLIDEEIDRLVESIHQSTNGASRKASGYAASNLDIYQVNSTYYDALGRNDAAYLIARAIQFFSPGTPQVYYVGLLAGTNDLNLVNKTGVGRDINRHYYSREEIRGELERPVVSKLIDLIRLRNELPVFDGSFSVRESGEGEMILKWDTDNACAQLHVSFAGMWASIDTTVLGETRRYHIGGEHLFKSATCNDSI